ncbi:MAG: 5-formyltetrahydrofolate cyclo-ligase [Tsuneonella sp.]
MDSKQDLRRALRAVRREHVAALPGSTRALLFMRPPSALLTLVPEGAPVGLYHAQENEAPTAAYARYFHEQGHPIALPRFADRGAPMGFARYEDPYAESGLEPGPFGVLQPAAHAEAVEPQVLFVPLVGFTEEGARLGQGGGHYDRWLTAHPDALAIGLAWDCQRVEALPSEPHDVPLAAVVTPTRLYGPFL